MIALYSNIEIASLRRRLQREFGVYAPAGFNTWMTDVMRIGADADPGAGDTAITDAYFILHGAGDLDLPTAEGAISHYATAHPQTTCYVSNLTTPATAIAPLKGQYAHYAQERAWDAAIERLLDLPNVYLLDIRALLAEGGADALYSDKIWYLSSNPFSANGEKRLAALIVRLVTAHTTPRKKVLLVDLDNTLWGGVIGEDGTEGITLDFHKEGARYRDFQTQLLRIKDTGVLLGIVSKNNPDDARAAFEHPAMVLKWDDFAVIKTNWEPKALNIAAIANELNLGLDSFVFVDDNPVERAAVTSALPQVTVPEWPEATEHLARFAADLYRDWFFTFDLSAEDRTKTEQYAANAARTRAAAEYLTPEDFLRDMDMQLEIRAAGQSDVARAAQMTLKTNQFNLTTRRIDEAHMRTLVADDAVRVYIGAVRDKFGDNGQTVLALAKQQPDGAWSLTDFLMSCRVMSRNIEFAFLKHITDLLVAQGATAIQASYIPSAKNAPAADFFADAGFTLTATDDCGTRHYRWQPGDPPLRAADYITVS
ncbi:MAG: HAD-IIIC family phosphatase [Actinomycetes bacterium]|jgi:FkbH-like protein|nr:HAD-IIIC family phosphatase [Actinomycetes bacterium]